MATKVDPPKGAVVEGKHYYEIWGTVFEIDTKYVPIEPIARGPYGVVCSALNEETDEKVAIKKIPNVFENDTEARRTLLELRLLRELRHPNIITIKDIIKASQKHNFDDVYLVYELMDTDLDEIIKSPRTLDDDDIRPILSQLLLGLKYLHSSNAVHRDLKPSNIQLDANNQLKICDFGLSWMSSLEEHSLDAYNAATTWYRAPELLYYEGDEKSSSVDIWSVGCIFAELLGRKPIFPGSIDNDIKQLKYIISVLGIPGDDELDFIHNEYSRSFIKSLPVNPQTTLQSLLPEADPEAIDLLEKMLVFDPRKRISVSEAFEHPYLAPKPEPVVKPPKFEREKAREKVWEEMLYYHPEPQPEVAISDEVPCSV